MVAWFARDLRFDFFGWPFSFWVGAQGALVVYVLMAALYAWRMNRADGEAAADSLAAPAPAPSQGASRGTGTDAA
ncbi:putative solute:sodium symporter small subunit [compost metagenome]